MKVLNLYAGIGGNRKLWNGVDVTAVEINKEIAMEYQNNFPDDKIIITDAHQYLLEHYNEFDFIWSSPPCPTHSNVNNFLNAQGVKRYPDIKLYEEIIFLTHFSKCKWIVENVISYYKPLIKPYEVDRHYFWSNFVIPKTRFKPKSLTITNSRQSTRRNKNVHIDSLQRYHGIYSNNLQALMNCVNPQLGLYVYNCAFKTIQEKIN